MHINNSMWKHSETHKPNKTHQQSQHLQDGIYSLTITMRSSIEYKGLNHFIVPKSAKMT